jgi:hypothetical protein
MQLKALKEERMKVVIELKREDEEICDKVSNFTISVLTGNRCNFF